MKELTDLEKKKDILDAYMGYVKAYTARDWEKTTGVFSGGFTMFGTGIDEAGFDREASLALFRREFEQAPDKVTYRLREHRVFDLGPDVALVMAVMDMEMISRGHHRVETHNNRTTAVMKREGGVWKLAHAHWSQPDSIQDVGESVPYRLLVERSHELEEKVRERTRQVKQQNIRLQKLNRTKDKLFSVMAHDLKNPFNAILGMSELLMSHHERLDAEKVNRHLRLIHTQAGKTYRMLENLLDWARSQTEEISFQPEKVNLREAAEEVLLSFRPLAGGKSIRLLNSIPENMDCTADRHMLGIILSNLMANAVKFSCSNSLIEVSARASGEAAEVSVSDQGVGIDPGRLKILLDGEPNASTRGTSRETGTGLGLNLCREFVKKHGGVIRVESVVGEGSTFSFTLPQHKNGG
jgi:signal transduction histidine kinase